MTESGIQRVTATDAALAAIERLEARHGPLMFVQSGGCCDGSSPICLSQGELLVGSNDLLLGEVGGAPFYMDAEQYERWRRPRLLIDVEPGGGDSFSLEGSDGVHFVARTQTPGHEARRAVMVVCGVHVPTVVAAV
jgi:uncharacterized protein (DUF779 family)